MNKNIVHQIASCLIALLFIGDSYAENSVGIDITKLTTALEIDFNMLSYSDSNNLNIDDVVLLDQNKFQKYSWDSITSEKSIMWLTFILQNNSGVNKNVVLGTSKFDFLELYTQNKEGKWESKYSGNKQINNVKEIVFDANSYIDIYIPKNGKTTVFIKAINHFKIKHQYSPLPFTLYNKQSFSSYTKQQHFYNYFFLGAILIITLYNLALFFQLKSKIYLLYVLNNFVILAFVTAQSGVTSDFLFNSFEYHEHILLILGNIAFVFYVLFSKAFLNLKKNKPKLNTFLNKVLWIWTLPLIFVFINKPLIAVSFGGIVALVVYTLIIVATVQEIKKGSQSAKYFLMGNIFYYIGIVISILQISFVLPTVFLGFSAINYVQLGTIFQLSLFSLTLGYDIIRIREDIVKLTKAKNKELEDKVQERTESLSNRNVEIEEMLLEKEILMKEIHHRVKNNLQLTSSLLNLQSNRVEDEKVKAALQNGQLRIKSMLLVHQKLYQSESFSEIDVQIYLTELTKEIAKTYAQDGRGIEIKINANLVLSIDLVIPLGLIVNELVTNSFKYAFKEKNIGEISISLNKNSNNIYTLAFKDSGKGFNEKDVDYKKSLGLKLVGMLSKQLGGEFIVSTAKGGGFTVEFPERIID